MKRKIFFIIFVNDKIATEHYDLTQSSSATNK